MAKYKLEIMHIKFLYQNYSHTSKHFISLWKLNSDTIFSRRFPGPLGPAEAGSGTLPHGTCHADPGSSVCLSVSLPRLWTPHVDFTTTRLGKATWIQGRLAHFIDKKAEAQRLEAISPNHTVGLRPGHVCSCALSRIRAASRMGLPQAWLCSHRPGT